MRLKCFRHRGQMCLLFVLFSLLVGCETHDQAYYRTHPQALFAALNTCDVQQLTQDPCREWKKMADTFQSLSIALRQDPQVFGQKIIKLESKCVNLTPASEEKIACYAALELRYAVVKWFESPEKQ